MIFDANVKSTKLALEFNDEWLQWWFLRLSDLIKTYLLSSD
jgi:hypothetical protein